MKKQFFTLAMASGLSAMAFSQTFSLAPILNESDKEEVLKIIDQVCADSWCAGDYDYKFSAFSCNENQKTCSLSFKIIDRDAKPGTINFQNKRCIFKDITSREKILDGSSLNEEFYDQLNYCVSNRESRHKL